MIKPKCRTIIRLFFFLLFLCFLIIAFIFGFILGKKYGTALNSDKPQTISKTNIVVHTKTNQVKQIITNIIQINTNLIQSISTNGGAVFYYPFVLTNQLVELEITKKIYEYIKYSMILKAGFTYPVGFVVGGGVRIYNDWFLFVEGGFIYTNKYIYIGAGYAF